MSFMMYCKSGTCSVESYSNLIGLGCTSEIISTSIGDSRYTLGLMIFKVDNASCIF